MFGMLDYRARKLYKLVNTPGVILLIVMRFLAFPFLIAIYFAAQVRGFGFLLALFGGLICQIIISSLIHLSAIFCEKMTWKVFNFFIDPIPARGRTQEQAFMIVRNGKLAELLSELDAVSPNHWSDSLIERASSQGFFQRIFYKNKTKERLICMRDWHISYGATEPFKLQKHLTERHLSVSTFETLLVSGSIPYSLIEAAILVVIFLQFQ